MENYVAIYLPGREHRDKQATLTHVVIVNSSLKVLLEAKCENAHCIEPRKYRVERNGEFVGYMSLDSCRQEIAAILEGKVLVGHDVHHDLKVLNLTHPKQNIRDMALHRPFHEWFMLLKDGLLRDYETLLQGEKLWYASYDGDVDVVQELLNDCQSNPAVVNTKGGEDGVTPLHVASMNGHTQVMKVLLHHGAQIEARDKFGYTPLALASLWGHTGSIDLLLSYRAQVDVRNVQGDTPLTSASRSGHTEAIKLLLRQGANVNAENIHQRDTPLIVASFHGHADAVGLLLCYKPRLDNIDIQGLTALDWAVGKGHAQVVKLLCGYQTSLLLQGQELWYASRDGQVDVVRSLLDDCKSNPTVLNFQRGGVASFRGHADTVGLKPLLDIIDNWGQAELDWAIRNGIHAEVVKVFYDYQTSLLLQGQELWYASRDGQVDVVRSLLDDCKSDPTVLNFQRGYGDTPIHVASRNGHTDVMEVLLRQGAYVDAQNNRGNTPLIVASQSGRADAVLILLRHQARLDIRDHTGRSALNWAVRNEHAQVVELLSVY